MSVVPCTVRQVTGLSHSALKNVNQYRSKFVTHKIGPLPLSEQPGKISRLFMQVLFSMCVCPKSIFLRPISQTKNWLCVQRRAMKAYW